MSEIEAASVALDAARTELAKVDREIRAACEDAAAAVRARFEEARAAAYAVVCERERELRNAKNATPDHPWVGKKVFLMVPQGRSYERRPDLRVEGIVETRRIGTQFPANVRWGIPEIGAPFVRLLKKDGTPGTKFESIHGVRGRKWQLAEDSE